MQNRRHKVTTVLLMILAASFAGGAFSHWAFSAHTANAQTASAPYIAKVVRAERFVLHHPDGKVAAVMGEGLSEDKKSEKAKREPVHQSPGLYIFNREGKKVLSAYVLVDKMPRMQMWAYGEGNLNSASALFDVGPGGGGFSISGPSVPMVRKADKIMMGVDKKGCHFYLSNEETDINHRSAFGVDRSKDTAKLVYGLFGD